MNQFIAASKFIGHSLLTVLLIFSACHSQSKKETSGHRENIESYKQRNLVLSSGKELKVFMALSSKQQTQGLSGLKEHEFAKNEAMFFPGKAPMMRGFWMPDTYFNLDIFFIDQNMKIVEIERNVPHHPGRQEPPTIARTKQVFCQHVLEIRSDSPLAKELRFGQQLNWKD